jgi:hypothetical protein
MSWLQPHAKEPTHEQFILAWMRNKTVYQVSEALAELGYMEMTPAVCMDWYRSFRGIGAQLPHRKWTLGRF